MLGKGREGKGREGNLILFLILSLARGGGERIVGAPPTHFPFPISHFAFLISHFDMGQLVCA